MQGCGEELYNPLVSNSSVLQRYIWTRGRRDYEIIWDQFNLVLRLIHHLEVRKF